MKRNNPTLCISPEEESLGVFIGTGKKGARGQPLAQSTGAATHVGPRKRSQSLVSTAVPEQCAHRRLLNATRLSPCRLHVPVSGFGPLVLMKLLSKVNGYIIGL